MFSLRGDFMVDLVRKRRPVPISRKQTLLSVGWPSGFMAKDLEFRVSALASLVTGLNLVDHVDLAAAAHDLARRVALLRGFDGGNNFHKRSRKAAGTPGCQLDTPAS
jgi:hypothetical protein